LYAFADGIFFDAESAGSFLYRYPVLGFVLGCVLNFSHEEDTRPSGPVPKALESILALLQKVRGPME